MRGRGAAFNTPNRFDRQHFEPLDLEPDPDDDGKRAVKTVYLKDSSRSILAKNDSPDVPYTYSINPYRGCEHGCIYCYARNSHEYLGFSAGIDFETKIMVKQDAPELLEEAFRKKSWQPQMVCFSGNTDCYQPVERKLQITRRCLEVFLKFRNPVGVITKNNLILRDIDIIKELASMNLVITTISITTLDEDLARVMEPRTSTPANRLQAVERIAAAGIPVTVNLAPIIPGLNDEEMPSILREAANCGARSASYTMLHLASALQPLFVEWVQRELPDRAPKILNRIRETRGGKLNDSTFGKRMKGEGEIAESIGKLFKLNRAKYGLAGNHFAFSTDLFRRDVEEKGQMRLAL